MHDGMTSADTQRARLLTYRDARRKSRILFNDNGSAASAAFRRLNPLCQSYYDKSTIE